MAKSKVMSESELSTLLEVDNIGTKIKKVRKRSGELVKFDINKIVEAIWRAAQSVGGEDRQTAERVATKVVIQLEKKFDKKNHPEIENVQDAVEKVLIEEGHAKTAKAFIIYRIERAALRQEQLQLSLAEQEKVRANSNYFRNQLAEFVYYTSYSKWMEDKRRRETWEETIDRFIDFMKYNLKDKLTTKEYKEIRQVILDQEVIPSMRLVWSSGKAAKATNVAAYNCSFIAISELRDFGEIMYISMCGTGVGFSVEQESISKLPKVTPQTGKKPKKLVVEDSKEGWAQSFIDALEIWFAGGDVDVDYSKVRPAGARLKTMGGRASGPAPLQDLMKFTREKVMARQGQQLSSLDVHDIACKVGEIVIAGGVRRSAMISLSDLNDTEMRHAKDGTFWNNNPQRSMSNNSAIYTTRPTDIEFMEEWLALAKSGSGERGIFNRGNMEKQLPKRRMKNFKDYIQGCGTNPCGEIILRSKQFCNLTAIVLREDDDLKSMKRKIKYATILGTYQASLTNFKFLSKEWRKNCEEEALLGVSFTGYFDNKEIRKDDVLAKLRDESVKVNKKYAKRFGINQSTCVTCVKPSGNSSQLLDTSSGMHPRYSQYYIRRVRVSANDPIFNMMKDQGVPYNPEVGQTEETATTFVLDFPVAAPKDAIVKDDVSALGLLEEWKRIKVNFTEHNPSCTIYVGDDEWLDVAKWLQDNWDIVGGLSFLPRNDHVYQLAPYEAIDKKKYEELTAKMPNIDFAKLPYYERQDETKGSKELACVAGQCEI